MGNPDHRTFCLNSSPYLHISHTCPVTGLKWVEIVSLGLAWTQTARACLGRVPCMHFIDPAATCYSSGEFTGHAHGMIEQRAQRPCTSLMRSICKIELLMPESCSRFCRALENQTPSQGRVLFHAHAVVAVLATLPSGMADRCGACS